MLAERVSQRPRTPNKHPAVPQEIAGPHELLCDLSGRLLGEATDLEHASCRLTANFDVAVTGFRPSGRDADYNNILTASRNRRRPLDVLTKALLVCDDMIGRKHSDNSSGIAPRQKKSRQANRRGRVSSRRFGDDLLLLQALELAHNRIAQIFVGNDPELLGHALAAQRPEARAASAGENHGIKSKLAQSQFPRYARDFACGLKRPQNSSTSRPPRRATSSCYGALTGWLRTVSGSATTPEGSDMRMISSSHCGRTVYSRTEAGMTTASPVAKLMGSMPCDSTIPAPSIATTTCGEAGLTSACRRSCSLILSTWKNGERTKTSGPSLARRTTLPAFVCSLVAAKPSAMCNSRGRP